MNGSNDKGRANSRSNELAVEAAKALRALDQEETRLRAVLADLEDGGLLRHSPDGDQLVAPEDTSLDAGSELTERSLELGLVESIETQLDEVAAARIRVWAGRYGCCSQCGERIDPERLVAVPQAQTCVAHAPPS